MPHRVELPLLPDLTYYSQRLMFFTPIKLPGCPLTLEKLSVFITTYNNERTLPTCLESVKWADEIVVLDSLSNDATLEIAQRYGCRIFQHAFMGYSKQKQMALDHTIHRWVLLLDSDEALSPALQVEIKHLLTTGLDADGYEFPRLEQLFWRMNNPNVRLNHFLRLFDKTKGRISTAPIHESPEVEGAIKRINLPFYHYGETSIHLKVDKTNKYSTGMAQHKIAQGARANPWVMVFYPPLYFLRTYVFKRNFLNGWAGFITAVIGAFYVFLKYAKLYEHYQIQQHGDPLPPQKSAGDIPQDTSSRKSPEKSGEKINSHS